jgi:hypothetical protein
MAKGKAGKGKGKLVIAIGVGKAPPAMSKPGKGVPGKGMSESGALDRTIDKSGGGKVGRLAAGGFMKQRGR